MTQTIRAIYEGGTLRLLDPVELTEGQQVEVYLLTEREIARAALKDLLVPADPADDEDEELDEAALLREINADFRGKEPLSETIIQERREGP